MKRPMIVIATIFITGVAFGLLSGERTFILTITAISVMTGMLIVRPVWRNMALLVVVFLLVGIYAGVSQKHKETFIHYLDNDILELEEIAFLDARILEVYRSKHPRVSYRAEITGVRLEYGGITKLTRGQVLLNIYEPDGSMDLINLGEKIEIHDFVLQENLLKNTSNTYYKYLQNQGMSAILNTDPQHIQFTSGSRLNPANAASKTKVSMQRFIGQHLDPPESTVLKSIMLGNQGYLSDDLRRIFSRTGTAHIIAVSGLHTGIIAMAAHELTKIAGVGIRKGKWFTLAIVWFYALIAGLPVSILRAGTMITLLILSFFLKRHYDSRNALMIAAMIFIAINPYTLKTVSFQLSFLATASIIWGLSLCKNTLKLKYNNKAWNLLTISILVQMGTWPVVAYHFNELSIISPVSNLLIVPVLGLLMTATLGAWLLNWIPFLADFLMHTVNGMLIYMIRAMTFLAEKPYAAIRIEKMSLTMVLLYYLFVLVVLGTVLKIESIKELIRVKFNDKSGGDLSGL
ncbi:MAG: ComEC/Rec2 family competence protein [Tindallia sp. MSAO_Bac2]|nr:MAG: ComEC/Rec2 family competence protein [Tindallia sp. MSAO_Bac2]